MKLVPNNYSFVFARVNGADDKERIFNACEWATYWLKFQSLVGASGSVVFDIDDTLVDSREKRIQAVCRIYSLCLNLNFVVNIITARPESKANRLATVKMLHANGIRTYEALYMMPADIDVDYTSISQYKHTARNDVASRHNILANFGDMWTDHLRYPCRVKELKARAAEECVILFPPECSYACIKLPGQRSED